MTTDGTHLQSLKSINTPEFENLMKELMVCTMGLQVDAGRQVMKRIISHIDARLEECALRSEEAVKTCMRVHERLQQVEFERDGFRHRVVTEETRAIAAEDRLGEIRAGVADLMRHGFENSFGGDFGLEPDGPYIDREAVLALFGPPEPEPEPKVKDNGARVTVTVTHYKLATGEDGAPIREVQPAPAEGSFTREEARAAVIAVRDEKS